jgi:hypothetical protein
MPNIAKPPTPYQPDPNRADPWYLGIPFLDDIGQGLSNMFSGSDRPADTVESRSRDILEKIGVKQGPQQAYSYDEILSAFHSAGIDISQAPVQVAAQGIAQLRSLGAGAEEQAKMMDAAARSQGGLLEKYPIEVSDYSTVVQKYGLQDILNDYPTKKKRVPGPAGHILAEQGIEMPGKPKDYVVKGDAVVYNNGIVALPNANQVFFPISAKVEGSSLWLAKAQKTWSAEKVKNWRSDLYKQGYQVSKKGDGWDAQLISATQEYYRNKYLNYGKAVPTGNAPGGTGPGGAAPKPVDMHRYIGSIQADIIQQYRSVFNADPTPDELESWTNFVMKKGMELQRGPLSQRLTPSAALGEAQARAATRLYGTPQAKFLRESSEENTSLHQGLVNAIAASQGVMR